MRVADNDVYMDVSEIEATIQVQEHKLTVKKLRRILPIMQVICYKSDIEIAQKRKSKCIQLVFFFEFSLQFNF